MLGEALFGGSLDMLSSPLGHVGVVGAHPLPVVPPAIGSSRFEI